MAGSRQFLVRRWQPLRRAGRDSAGSVSAARYGVGRVRGEPQQYFDAGDSIIVTGRYSGAYKATGKKIDAQFAHFWTLAGGKVTRFQQYTDTLQAAQAAKA